MAPPKGHRPSNVFADFVKKAVRLFASSGTGCEMWSEFVQALVEGLVDDNGHPHGLTDISTNMIKAHTRGSHRLPERLNQL